MATKTLFLIPCRFVPSIPPIILFEKSWNGFFLNILGSGGVSDMFAGRFLRRLPPFSKLDATNRRQDTLVKGQGHVF
jgi:hypothetical protein